MEAGSLIQGSLDDISQLSLGTQLALCIGTADRVPAHLLPPTWHRRHAEAPGRVGEGHILGPPAIGALSHPTCLGRVPLLK